MPFIVDSFNSIISEYDRLKATHKKILTNFPLLSEEMKVAVNNGLIQMEIINQTIYLIEDRDSFYRLFYMIPDSYVEKMGNTTIEFTKPVICEVVEREGKEKQLSVINKLNSWGYKKYKKYFRYDNDLESITDSPNTESELEPLTMDVMDDIIRIFDKYSDFIPNKAQINDFVSERKMVRAYYEENFAGAFTYLQKGGIVEGEFFYVLPSCRNGSVALILMEKFLQEAKRDTQVKKVVGWVEENNIKSVKTHEFMGYKKNSQYKIVYKKG